MLHTTLDIKSITSWLVCRVLHGHSVPRLGIQGLTLRVTAGFLFYWAQKSGQKMEGQNCWERYGCIWKVILEWFVAGEIETKYLSFLVRETKCMSQDGMEGVCRVVVVCTQPDRWKITIANPNEDGFTEWRCLFLECCCLSMLRSL